MLHLPAAKVLPAWKPRLIFAEFKLVTVGLSSLPASAPIAILLPPPIFPSNTWRPIPILPPANLRSQPALFPIKIDSLACTFLPAQDPISILLHVVERAIPTQCPISILHFPVVRLYPDDWPIPMLSVAPLVIPAVPEPVCGPASVSYTHLTLPTSLAV